MDIDALLQVFENASAFKASFGVASRLVEQAARESTEIIADTDRQIAYELHDANLFVKADRIAASEILASTGGFFCLDENDEMAATSRS